MAQIHQLFKRAMDRYGVQSKQLADLAEISAVHLSEFRNGRKWLSQDVFESLLEGMEQLSPGSKRYFCELLAGEQLREKEDNVLTLIRLIEDATDEEMDAVLLTIGRKWKESRLNSAISLDYSPNKNSAIAV